MLFDERVVPGGQFWDAAVGLWAGRDGWPEYSIPGYRFLGDAIHDVGAHMFPDSWKRLDPISAPGATIYSQDDDVRLVFENARLEARSNALASAGLTDPDLAIGPLNLAEERAAALSVIERRFRYAAPGADAVSARNLWQLFDRDTWHEIEAAAAARRERGGAAMIRWERVAEALWEGLQTGAIGYILWDATRCEQISGQSNWFRRNRTMGNFMLCKLNAEDLHFDRSDSGDLIFVDAASVAASLASVPRSFHSPDLGWRRVGKERSEDWAVRDEVDREARRRLTLSGIVPTETAICHALSEMWLEINGRIVKPQSFVTYRAARKREKLESGA